MADLTSMQQVGAPAPSFTQVSPVTMQRDDSAVLGLAGSVGQGLMNLRTNVEKSRADQQKLALEQQTNEALGSFSEALTATSNLPANQQRVAKRKVFNQYLSENPAMSQDLAKAYKLVTGEEPVSKSLEQESFEKTQKEAWDNGFGSPLLSPELNAQYYSKFVEGKAIVESANVRLKQLELETAETASEKRRNKNQVLGAVKDIVGVQFTGVQSQLEAFRTEVMNSGYDAETMAAVTFQVNQMEASIKQALVQQGGEFGTDPDIVALFQPQIDLINSYKSFLNGQVTEDAFNRQAAINIGKQKAMMTTDPRVATAAAIDQVVPNSISKGIEVEKLVSGYMVDWAAVRDEKGNITPINPGEQSPKETKFAQEAIKDSLADMANPDRKQQAADKVNAYALGFEINGSNLTDEEKFTAMSIMATDGAFESLSPEAQTSLVDAAARYLPDVAEKITKDVMGEVRVMEETYSARGEVMLNNVKADPLEVFELKATEKGLTFVAKGPLSNAMRRELVRRNAELAQLDDTLTVLSKGTGMSKQEAAEAFLGFRFEAPEKEQKEATAVPRGQRDERPQYGVQPQQGQAGYPAAPQELQGQAERGYEMFGAPSTGVYQGNEQTRQERVQMPVASRFADLADAMQQGIFGDEASRARMQARRQDGEGTVLAPDTYTGATAPREEAFIDRVQKAEGEGDLVSKVTTGKAGVTSAALKAINYPEQNPKNITDEQSREVVRQYTAHLDQGFKANLAGYENLSEEARYAILDNAYNLGPNIAKFPKFKAAVEAGDEVGALRELLDTANESGKSVKGLAKRRAENYNMVASNPIKTIKQSANGRVEYLDKDGNTIFAYTPKGGRHDSSKAGTVSL